MAQIIYCIDEVWDESRELQLIPQDILLLNGIISSLGVIPCDALIISGHATVSEAMLSGESIPITKSEIRLANIPTKNGVIDMQSNALKQSTIYAGSQLLQTRPSALGSEEPMVQFLCKLMHNYA